MNPRSFISGVPLEFKLHFQLVCGSHGPAKPSTFVPPFAGKRYEAAAPLLLQSEPLHHLNLLSVRHRSAHEPHQDIQLDDLLQEPPLDAPAMMPYAPEPPPDPVILDEGVDDDPELHHSTRTRVQLSSFLEPITLADVTVATEGHEAAIVDFPNAFVQVNLPESPFKGNKHLIRRYLATSGNVLKGCKSVEYCPTTEMIADYFTKPLQGKPFVKFRKAIMNLQD